MRVVPVSIADKAFGIESVTVLPLTARPDKGWEWGTTSCSKKYYPRTRDNSQKEGSAARLMNSMSPLKSDEFVPPRVKTPPGAREVWEAGWSSCANQNDISGALSRLLLLRFCKKGIASVLARDQKAKPIRPDTGAFTRPVVIESTVTR